MPEINIKDMRIDEQGNFNVIRPVGTVVQTEEQNVVTLNQNITKDELFGYDDSAINIDADGNTISVKETLNLRRVLDHIKRFRERGIDLTIDEYFERSGYRFSNGDPFTMKDIYNSMGFDPRRHTIDFLLTTDKVAGSRELVPEIIRGFLEKDLVQNGIYRNLIASERRISQVEEQVPHINYSGSAAQMEAIGEAEHLPLGSVSFGRKTVRITRRGVGIAITDPVRQYVTVDQLGIYLRDVQRRLDNDLTSDAISILQNGDNPSSTDPIGALGVDNTSDRAVYKDYLRLYIRYMMSSYMPNTIIVNEDEALRQMLVSEFKPNANVAPPQFALNLGNSGMQKSATMFIHADIADYKQLFLDPRFALEYLVSEPMSVEPERKAGIETNAYYIRMTSGFSNLIQTAKVLLDGTQAFSDTGWPSYLTLNK